MSSHRFVCVSCERVVLYKKKNEQKQNTEQEQKASTSENQKETK